MVSRENTESRAIRLLRIIAQLVLLGGAVGSLGLMLNPGRHTPILLLILFVGWVLSPFMALLATNVISKRWSLISRVTLYCLMLVIAIGSLVGYSGVLSTPDAKPAFIFLMVPLISWLLIAIVIPLAGYLSRRRSRSGDRV